jgi:hypothetical protein
MLQGFLAASAGLDNAATKLQQLWKALLKVAEVTLFVTC